MAQPLRLRATWPNTSRHSSAPRTLNIFSRASARPGCQRIDDPEGAGCPIVGCKPASHMRYLRRRGVGTCLAISTPAVLPSVGRKTSAPRTCLTPLNTSPAPSPVNASRLPSRTPAHHSGPVRFATPSPRRTSTVYLLPVSRRTRPQHQFRTYGWERPGLKPGQ